ncbi:MAG: superinfection immunity protein [Candidatus Omnitrophica bacterium CG08_land_8_20_14_0_20_41_16]|uniref:Superinfection immunity protein n=1 Tax=Candidatus Sherwoodlollariibacterium unditelluris TaxID=1974757 RepID=A0A2G9YI94_9BACT|nr:MAG: superinfection immunity protein [Candidatus Omnitrophica bacterium CG23_combo_of_CG06-09_8_20_14_all_41_10]PIS33326.1 MAG: superinfection immunity protein [Candidatus Omnitrophica bacterium CG08_land_8_20_14_0_20_41_16]
MQNFTILELLLVVLIFAIYFLPTLIAFLRQHKNSLAIFLLNLLLGWTVLGWVVSLVWSVMK